MLLCFHTLFLFLDYPYPTNFEAPLPGFPVNVSCHLMQHEPNPLRMLAVGAGMYYNGSNGCFDIYADFVECADKTGCGTGPAGIAWDYLACTEIIYYPCSNGRTDMFPPSEWNNDNLTQYCQAKYGVVPRPDFLLDEFGAGNISSSATRIIFSNGLLDPWSAGGFMKALSPTLTAVVISEGAHHLDLRSANPLDPASVVFARTTEVNTLLSWMAEINTDV